MRWVSWEVESLLGFVTDSSGVVTEGQLIVNYVIYTILTVSHVSHLSIDNSRRRYVRLLSEINTHILSFGNIIALLISWFLLGILFQCWWKTTCSNFKLSCDCKSIIVNIWSTLYFLLKLCYHHTAVYLWSLTIIKLSVNGHKVLHSGVFFFFGHSMFWKEMRYWYFLAFGKYVMKSQSALKTLLSRYTTSFMTSVLI